MAEVGCFQLTDDSSRTWSENLSPFSSFSTMVRYNQIHVIKQIVSVRSSIFRINQSTWIFDMKVSINIAAHRKSGGTVLLVFVKVVAPRNWHVICCQLKKVIIDWFFRYAKLILINYQLTNNPVMLIVETHSGFHYCKFLKGFGVWSIVCFITQFNANLVFFHKFNL